MLKKSTLMMSFFMLSFLLNNCSRSLDAISIDTQTHIKEMLSIVTPTTEQHEDVKVYTVPKTKYCTKDMTLKECFILQNTSNRKLSYTLINQINAVKEHNKRYR